MSVGSAISRDESIHRASYESDRAGKILILVFQRQQTLDSMGRDNLNLNLLNVPRSEPEGNLIKLIRLLPKPGNSCASNFLVRGPEVRSVSFRCFCPSPTSTALFRQCSPSSCKVGVPTNARSAESVS
jgi:hypothetical protein